jgi:type I restriction enzyme M protein
MDPVLEPTKKAVLDTKKTLDDARITEQRAALSAAAGTLRYANSCLPMNLTRAVA